MFSIKICGITRVEDAMTAALAGADAIGLNFYERSPRCVDVHRARAIVDELPVDVAKVGVFVDHPVEQIVRLTDALGLDFVQLHGDEPPAAIGQLADSAVIRALRLQPGALHKAIEYLDQCRNLGCLPVAALVDAYAPGQYGGTGQIADWIALREWSSGMAGLPLVLAGGLNPDNVAEAIRIVCPDAVDTASGVESSPGVKDAKRLRAFVTLARQAFAAAQRSRESG